MKVIGFGTGPLRAAPVAGGPQVDVLVEDERDGDAATTGPAGVAAARVVIPPGGAMPEHAHGESEALVVPLSGTLTMASGEQEEKVAPGCVVLLGRGERVRLDNGTGEPVQLLVVFGPPAFVRTLLAWPVVP